MPKTRLGIDIGTNSIGWFLYSLSESKGGGVKIDGVVDAGVRIFASGRDPQSYTSLNEDRRKARMARRQRDRYLQRRNQLVQSLAKFGLFPSTTENGEFVPDYITGKALAKLDPWQLRAEAAEKRLPPFHVGRAIFHLNQRRGFKSNRIIDKGKDDGPVKDSVKQFRAQLGGKTVGQFLWERKCAGESVRARRVIVKEVVDGKNKIVSDSYKFYPERAMIADEFHAIWDEQAKHHPDIFTEDAREQIGGKKGDENPNGAIFRQRPLKPPIVGKCRYLPKEERAPRALPSFQRFRILKEANNLRYYDIGGEEKKLPSEVRTEIIRKLTSQKSMSFGKMKQILRQYDKRVHEFNFEDNKRKGFEGDETNAVLGEIIGDRWNAVSLAERDELVDLLLSDKGDDEAARTLAKKWRINEKQAHACIDKSIHLPSGRGSLSRCAIYKMLPHLESGLGEYEAAREAGFSLEPHDKSAKLAAQLSHYTQSLSDHCLPRKHGNKDDIRIPNPTVHIALNQFRWVINDLIRRFGKPSEFVVELARDLPHGKIRRDEEKTKQRENEKNNKTRRELLKQEGLPATPDNMLRLRLWEELGDKNNRRCVFCGDVQFSVRRLFSHETHIEHILPRSRTLDDSPLNKTLSCGNCNRDKGNQSPDEKWRDDEERYAGILSRAKNFPERKRMRFQRGAMERFLDNRDFLDRQLVETRYIGRLARRYLEEISPRESIWVIPGRLTKLLRENSWGLNTILAEKKDLHERQEAYKILQDENASLEKRKEAAHREHEAMRRIGRKNRNDHRHHAVDAAVIGATTRAILKKFADAAGKAEESQLEEISAPNEPMPGFHNTVTEAIGRIIVSHKPRRHRERKLHDATAYGIVHDADKKEGIYKRAVVHQGVVKNLTVIPIADRAGNVYKAYRGDSNWAYEIYAAKNGKWGGEVIATFNANQQATDKSGKTYYSFVPEWRQKNPTARLVMRIHNDDMLAFEEKGKTRIVRVKEIGKGGVSFAEHCEANVDQRNRKRKKANKEGHGTIGMLQIESKSAASLQKSNGRKIHISPAGLVYDPGPPNDKKPNDRAHS